MIRENQRPLNFTDSQARQLKRTHDTLRKLNRAALGALGRIEHKALTDTEYRDAGESLALMGDRMMSALRVRRELLTAGREQLPLRIEVIFGGKRDACCEKGPRAKSDDHKADWREAEQDPRHRAEIESLLELALRTEVRASVRCESGHAPPKAFFSGISRLTSAVLRQQRELRETALKHEPEIKVMDPTDSCICCQQPLKTEGEED